jgi:hypothetical protein
MGSDELCGQIGWLFAPKALAIGFIELVKDPAINAPGDPLAHPDRNPTLSRGECPPLQSLTRRYLYSANEVIGSGHPGIQLDLVRSDLEDCHSFKTIWPIFEAIQVHAWMHPNTFILQSARIDTNRTAGRPTSKPGWRGDSFAAADLPLNVKIYSYSSSWVPRKRRSMEKRPLDFLWRRATRRRSSNPMLLIAAPSNKTRTSACWTCKVRTNTVKRIMPIRMSAAANREIMELE